VYIIIVYFTNMQKHIFFISRGRWRANSNLWCF